MTHAAQRAPAKAPGGPLPRRRRSAWSLLLPLLLVLAQHSALRHETGHALHRLTPTQHAVSDCDPCSACLGFSPLAGAVASASLPPALLTDLVQHRRTVHAPRSAEAALPAARSRGPPLL